MKRNVTLVSTSILGALVFLFDYTLKFSGLKIPFPLLPALKFDLTGIPIVLSTLMFNLPSGATTSAIAFLAILLRSGNIVDTSMKALAEFMTVLGIAPLMKRTDRVGRSLAIILGLSLRIVTMSIANVIILPIMYPNSYASSLAAVSFLPFLGIFNLIQGSISIVGGFLIYEAVTRRLAFMNILTTEKT